MKRFPLSLLVIVLSPATPGVRADDQDPVAARLEMAKSAYETEIEAVRRQAVAYLDVKEAKARAAGDKKTLDEVTAERRAFDTKSEMPKDVPPAVGTRVESARVTVGIAYEAAVRDYTRAKMDKRAAAVESEWKDFQQAMPFDGLWKSLFTGKDLKGWKQPPGDKSTWAVKKGVLEGYGTAGGVLVSDRDDWTDFQIRVVAKINDGGNSGVFIRIGSAMPNPWYEAQINSSHKTDPNKTGSLFVKGVRPAVCVHSVKTPPAAHDKWFEMEVIAEGDRIRILVDGKETADYTDPDKVSAKGAVGLQHHHPGSVVSVRKIEVRELRTGK
jgi:hypothetical protein